MSVVVRPADEGDIDGVAALLHENMSAKVSKERWRRLMDYPWRPANASRGCVAVDGGRIVGFLGLVYADRPIAGRTERFCNICAWYLLKDYRGRGIGQRIQEESVADPRLTYTILTATEATGRAFAGSGFKVLDDRRYILRRRSGRDVGLDLTDDPQRIAPALDVGERRVLEDHRHYNVRHVLFRFGGRACYLIAQMKRKGADIDYVEVMHVADATFLMVHGQSIANMLLNSDRAVLAIDQRFLPQMMDWESETLRLPRWYRSSRVAPGAIDHLYSEIPLLDLKL
jgi:GNAT superfamily N-acetyltransferase